jgi:hypothetical protein
MLLPGANPLIANVVWVLHCLFIAWVLLAPWSSSWEVAALHALVVPFVCLHWVLNDDTCVLTWLECSLRGVPAHASFVHQLVGPIYKFQAQHASAAAWVASFALWCVSLYHLRTTHAAELARAYHSLRATASSHLSGTSSSSTSTNNSKHEYAAATTTTRRRRNNISSN